jgi:hypothetical protein
MSSIRNRFFVLAISLALFSISLTQKGFSLGHSNPDSWPGWAIIVFGPMGLFSGLPANYVWLANPLLLVSWFGVVERRGIVMLAASLPSFMIAVSFLFCSRISVSDWGTVSAIDHPALGYWLWLTSIAWCIISGIIFMCCSAFKSKRNV